MGSERRAGVELPQQGDVAISAVGRRSCRRRGALLGHARTQHGLQIDMGGGADFSTLRQTLKVLRKLIGVSVLVQLVKEGVHRLRDLALLLKCMKGRFDKTGVVRVRRRVLADQHDRNSNQKNVDDFEVLPNREPELPPHKSLLFASMPVALSG